MGSRGLWWHCLQVHNVKYSDATESAATVNGDSSMAIVPYEVVASLDMMKRKEEQHPQFISPRRPSSSSLSQGSRRYVVPGATGIGSIRMSRGQRKAIDRFRKSDHQVLSRNVSGPRNIVFGNCLKVFKLRESSHRMLHSDSLTLAPSS